MLEWIRNRWTLGSKGTNGYYVVTLPRMMQNAYLHYVWSVWLVATLVASTSWSFPIACIALVWRTREKGTEFFCTKRRTKLIKASLICFLSLGALIAYCNQSHSHSCNQDNQTGNHSCCSHHNDDDSCAVRSHSSGWMGGSNVGSLDSSYRPGLETSEVYVTEYTYFEQALSNSLQTLKLGN